MKILVHQFLGKNHSWSVCGWGIATALIRQGHEVDLFSTDGIQHLPPHLKNNLIGYTEENQPKIFGKLPQPGYDAAISYTCMKNFPQYLRFASKNRFGIWCYEWAGKNALPTAFAKHYKSCDWLCAPSHFAKRVFNESGIPDKNITVIPHGINSKRYEQNTTITLPTKKSFKILANIAQNHLRKNIPGLLEAYGKAFTDKDDVCLILKAKERPVKSPFEVSLNGCLQSFDRKFPKHAEVRIFSEFVEDISALYRSVDCVYTMTFCEGFYFPGLEGIASGKMSIAPNWGGQVDFLNTDNALLVSGKEVRADPKSMYWEPKNNAIWFQPDVDDAVDKLKYSYLNFEKLNQQVELQRSSILQDYNWDSIVGKFLDKC